MHVFLRLAAITLLALSFSLPARAETAYKTVAAGRPSQIGGMTFYNKIDCSTLGKPKVTIPTQPAHGTVRVVWSTGKLTSTKVSSRCRGKMAHGMAIIYTPAKGYRGADVLKIGIRSVYHGTSSVYYRVTYNITVK